MKWPMGPLSDTYSIAHSDRNAESDRNTANYRLTYYR